MTFKTASWHNEGFECLSWVTLDIIVCDFQNWHLLWVASFPRDGYNWLSAVKLPCECDTFFRNSSSMCIRVWHLFINMNTHNAMFWQAASCHNVCGYPNVHLFERFLPMKAACLSVYLPTHLPTANKWGFGGRGLWSSCVHLATAEGDGVEIGGGSVLLSNGCLVWYCGVSTLKWERG